MTAWVYNVAVVIGYIVMAALGIIGAVALAGLALEEFGRKLRHGLSLHDLQQAIAEWRKAHPERAAKFDSRKDW